MNLRETGNLGEEYTARYLIEHGCEILCRNFRIRGGEIDIIAKKGDLLHIVEVKTRRPDPLLTGEEAITKRKRELIIRAAGEYLKRNGLELNCVFDVAVVESNSGRITGFKYIQRAFTA